MRFSQDPFAGFDPTQGSCETAGFLRSSALSWFDGRLDAALQYAVAATAVRCQDTHELCRLAQYWYVELLVKARDLDTGQRVLDAIEAGQGAAESPRVAATAHAVRGKLLFAMGSVDALSEVGKGLRIADRFGVRFLRPSSYVVMALGALRRGDMRECLHYVDKLANEALLGYFGQAAGAWVTAQAAEARSGVASAADLIAGIVTDRLVLRQLLVSEPAAASWLVRAATKLGARDLAELAVTGASAAAGTHPQFSVLRGSALHAAGLLEGDSGKLREAANLYPDRWCAASAREDMATLLATRYSERDKAVRTYESVLDLYSAVGAARDASRVANKLRDFGVRRGAVRTVEREGLLPHGLTNTEFAVAELVSQGHTNNEVGRQLFISRHTVAFHLKKVFQKMNVASRVELAATWKLAAQRAG